MFIYLDQFDRIWKDEAKYSQVDHGVEITVQTEYVCQRPLKQSTHSHAPSPSNTRTHTHTTSVLRLNSSFKGQARQSQEIKNKIK